MKMMRAVQGKLQMTMAAATVVDRHEASRAKRPTPNRNGSRAQSAKRPLALVSDLQVELKVPMAAAAVVPIERQEASRAKGTNGMR